MNLKTLMSDLRCCSAPHRGCDECTRNFMSDGCDRLEAEAAEAIEELLSGNMRLRTWVNDLQSGMYVNCVYCGHRYGPGETTPVSMADALKAHIEHCPEHPMSKLKAQFEHLQAELKKETELRMFFEKASRFIGQENFKAFAAGEKVDTDGLKVKYDVSKTSDGSMVYNCFVLRPDKDPAAIAALTAYAKATENKRLSEDILNWITPDEKVVVLPCKVGDVVYSTSPNQDKVIACYVPSLHTIARWIEDGVFGKTVFLTRKEADAVLARGRREPNA